MNSPVRISCLMLSRESNIILESNKVDAATLQDLKKQSKDGQERKAI